MRHIIFNYIKDRVVAKYNEPKKKGNPNMKPSFLGSDCLRKIRYGYLKVAPDYGWTWDRILNFKKGDAYHDIIKEFMEQAGILIPYRDRYGKIPKHWATGLPDKEFPVNDSDLDIKYAKVDSVLLLKDVPGIEPGLWLGEIKSVNQKKWDSKYLADGPMADHQQQGMPYVYLMEENLKAGKYSHIEELAGLENEPVKGIIYIYINREKDPKEETPPSEYWKEFIVPKDPEPFTKVIYKITAVKDYVSRDELPPKIENQVLCPWCEFRDKCAREDKE